MMCFNSQNQIHLIMMCDKECIINTPNHIVVLGIHLKLDPKS